MESALKSRQIHKKEMESLIKQGKPAGRLKNVLRREVDPEKV
jgi:hypothetical protein